MALLEKMSRKDMKITLFEQGIIYQRLLEQHKSLLVEYDKLKREFDELKEKVK